MSDLAVHHIPSASDPKCLGDVLGMELETTPQKTISLLDLRWRRKNSIVLDEGAGLHLGSSASQNSPETKIAFPYPKLGKGHRLETLFHARASEMTYASQVDALDPV